MTAVAVMALGALTLVPALCPGWVRGSMPCACRAESAIGQLRR